MPSDLKPLSAEEMDELGRTCKAWLPAPLAEMGLRAVHQIRALTERVAGLEADKARLKTEMRLFISGLAPADRGYLCLSRDVDSLRAALTAKGSDHAD